MVCGCGSSSLGNGAGGTDGEGGEAPAPGSSGGASTQGGTGGAGSTGNLECSCDDGVACTVDACDGGMCSHSADHTSCDDGLYCDLLEGCTEGLPCEVNFDCESSDSCVTAACDPITQRCRYTPVDADGDGQASLSCSGTDCNDADAAIRVGAVETCDGTDNDCDGALDPSADSGCDGGRVCLEANCVCQEPLLDCGSGDCVDPDIDDAHCGSCNSPCDEGLTCVDGECSCAEGQANCSEDAEPLCVETSVDPLHCGDCGAACDTGSACEDSACEMEAVWIRAFGSYDFDEPLMRHRLSVTKSGDIYVSTDMHDREHVELPGGAATLFGGEYNVVKLDADGNFQWAQPSSQFFDIIATDDGVYLFAGLGETARAVDLTVAGQVVHVDSGEGAFVAVLLDPTDGHVVWKDELTAAASNTGHIPQLARDSTDDVIALGLQPLGGFMHEGTALDRTFDHQKGFLARYDSDGFERIDWLTADSMVMSLSIDTNDNVIVKVPGARSGEFTFGGDTFMGSNLETFYVARFSPEGDHLNSFVTDLGSEPMVAMNDAAIAVSQYSWEDFFRKYTFSGAGGALTQSSNNVAGLGPDAVFVHGGSLHVAGTTNSSHDINGRDGFNGIAYAAFDVSDFSVLRSVSADFSSAAPHVYENVAGAELSPDGTTLVLAGNFGDSARAGSLPLVALPGDTGFAVAKFSVNH